MWAGHRRKINLNSSVTTPPTTPGVGSGVAENETVENASTATTPMAETTPVPSTDTRSTKRKLRTRTTTGDDGAGSTSVKRPKTGATAKEYAPPSTRLADLGGVTDAVEKMLELVAMPLCHPEIYLHTGVQPPRGVLLHGPPGCGKTLLANAVAGELQVPFINISAPSIVSGMSGESEKTLRDTFDEAKRVAPCLLFIDEIDAITPKRENAQREMERRIVAQFLTCMDELTWDKNDNKPVIVIGATNRPDSLDAALRRAGRFDHEISMAVPDENAREQILRVMCAKLRLEGDFDFVELARSTPGYVGADLAALTGAAGIIAVKRIFQQLSEGTLTIPDDPVAEGDPEMIVDPPPDVAPPEVLMTPDVPAPAGPFSNLSLPKGALGSSIASFLAAHPSPLTDAQLAPIFLTRDDFAQARAHVQPSAKREGFATVPDVTWSDVGAMHSTRDALHMTIVQPIKRPRLFARVGVVAPAGVLLWGPPGCGKTLLAKAVANESKANFISVKGPELLNKYVGESERAVRQVFTRARASAPCIIFFDELDALVPRRDDSLSESSARVVNTLLTELDGLDGRKGVYVIAATNRPDMIDPAMCRPGRLDKLLYVDLPSPEERAEILLTLIRNIPVTAQEGGAEAARTAICNLAKERCDGYSGADLASLVREAGVRALRRALGSFEVTEENDNDDAADVQVSPGDFESALLSMQPSVSLGQRRRYNALRNKFTGLPMKGAKDDEDKPTDDPLVSSI